MKNVIVMITFGTLLFLLIGCERVYQEFSDTLHEQATIADVVFTPSTHGTEIGLTTVKSGSIALDYDGNLGIGIGHGLQISDTTIPEKYAIVFQCKHGEFIITRKEVYEKLKDFKGRSVDVAYREKYRTLYETKDGKKQVVKRTLVDFDFLDATVLPKKE